MDTSGFRPEGSRPVTPIRPPGKLAKRFDAQGFARDYAAPIGLGILSLIVLGFAFWPTKKKEAPKEKKETPGNASSVTHVHNYFSKEERAEKKREAKKKEAAPPKDEKKSENEKPVDEAPDDSTDEEKPDDGGEEVKD